MDNNEGVFIFKHVFDHSNMIDANEICERTWDACATIGKDSNIKEVRLIKDGHIDFKFEVRIEFIRDPGDGWPTKFMYEMANLVYPMPM